MIHDMSRYGVVVPAPKTPEPGKFEPRRWERKPQPQPQGFSIARLVKKATRGMSLREAA